MKTYETEGSADPLLVGIALLEKGVTDKAKRFSVNAMARLHRSDAFKSRNPDAIAPCLKRADGTCISRSNANMDLCDGHPEGRPLMGNTPKKPSQK